MRWQGTGECEIGGYYQRLEQLIDYNQKLLESLGVSHPSLEKVVSLSSDHDLHGKLTGAGGGGFAFVLLTPRKDDGQEREEAVKVAKERLNEEGFRCWETLLQPQGVSVQTVD